MKILHAAAEIFPLVKTGGLADVVGALPQAQISAGADVRVILPGLPAIREAVLHPRTVFEAGPLFGAGRVALRLGRLPGSGVPAYLIEAPYLFARPGGPYQAADGSEWGDNLQRFALLGWMAAHLAAGELDTSWTPDVVHAHDWHAAMACAYMAAHPGTTARSVFTVHNLAFQGLFAQADFGELGLPARFLQSHGLEYHGQLSFMKAGLKYADRITTVSPTYAAEMATHEFGCGLDGVIRGRSGDVGGRRVAPPANLPTASSPKSTAKRPFRKGVLRGRLAPSGAQKVRTCGASPPLSRPRQRAAARRLSAA